MTPIRIKRGGRYTPLPPGAKWCGRPSRWGNPFKVGVLCEHGDVPDAETAVRFYRGWAADRLRADPKWLDPLRGCTALACECGPDGPCHVDVLIDLIRETE